MEDRLTEHPGRIKLTAVEDEENTYDVERAEGEVYAEGTAMNASNFTLEVNALIENALNGVEIDNNGNITAGNIQAGRGTCTVKKANTQYSCAVKFPKAFTTTPCVIAQPMADRSDTTTYCVANVSTTGFTYRCERTGAWNSSFCWIAIGI